MLSMKHLLAFLLLLGTCHLVTSFPFFDEDNFPESLTNSDADIMPLLEDSHPGKRAKNAPCVNTKPGCCQDGKTIAPGPGKGEGCDVVLCTDKHVQKCYDKRMGGKLNCAAPYEAENCKYSCKVCKPQANPVKECLKSSPNHGCCWDGKPALKPGGTDCAPCKNVYPQTCKMYRDISGGCASGSYGIRTFMNTYCPDACGICNLATGNGK